MLKVLSNIFTDYKTVCLTCGAVLLIKYVINFYSKVAKYPKGPYPWPFIGNLNYLISHFSQNHSLGDIVMELQAEYSPIFTIWVGPKPLVFISDPDLLKEAFSKTNFSGRPQLYVNQYFTGGSGHNIAMTDYGTVYKCLRNVTSLAIKNFSNSEKLPQLVNESIEKTFKVMITNNGNQGFDCADYTNKLVFNLVAATIFGKCYSLDDVEFQKQVNLYRKIMEVEQFAKLVVAEVLPSFLQPIYVSLLAKEPSDGFRSFNQLCQRQFRQHLNSYREGKIRDLGDLLISAQKETAEEGGVHLTDQNMGNIIMDLYFAAIDIIENQLNWMFLIMSKHPEIQMKMRQEIKKAIKDELPVQDDKNNCHYTMAFITETLRFRLMPIIGLPHRTLKDSVINGHMILSDTVVFSCLFGILNNPQYCYKPDEFDPNRFLDQNDNYYLDKLANFIPFGVGRRRCIGEVLAINDMFLILARMFQLTDGQMFVLADGIDSVDLKFKANVYHACIAKPFKLKLNNDKISCKSYGK